MTNKNIFEALSSFQAGLGTDPFENYCVSALAYLLETKQPQLTELLTSEAEGFSTIEATHSQAIVDDQIVSLLVELANNKRLFIKINTQPNNNLEERKKLQTIKADNAVLLWISFKGDTPPSNWVSVTWEQIVETLGKSSEKLALEFRNFVQTDILGHGSVTVQQALKTNKLYALGGAVIREKYGVSTEYLNSASQAIQGEFRYLGTTFSGNTPDLQFWIGIVNQTLPLSSRYQLILASKNSEVQNPVDKPRVTDNWNWKGWTGLGEITNSLEHSHYKDLLERLI